MLGPRAPSVAAGRRGLLERDRELEHVAALLGRAQDGQGGALVVEGPAGIGKTALLAAVRDLSRADGFRVLRARGAELEREFAFGVVRQLVEPALAEASDHERALLLAGAAGLAARVLGLPHTGAPAPAAPDPSFAVLHGLYWLCANLAAEHPLALVVDDAHWADSASLRFLAFLLPRLEELRVVVLLATRPVVARGGGALLAVLTTDPATEVVPLSPLTTRAVGRLLARSLGVEPQRDLAVACRHATGGVPFLVRTLGETLRQDRFATPTTSPARVQDLAAATLGRWARVQLGRLGPDAARLAGAVAVLERTELFEAASLAGLAPSVAASTTEVLVRAGVLQDQPLSFAHPILRAAVYGEIAADRRAEIHRQAARVLTGAGAGAARVAEHLLAAAPAGDPWVVEQLRAAAGTAGAAGAPESVATYLRRALAEPPSPAARPGLLLELGLAEYSSGQAGWQHHLEAAVATTDEDAPRVAAALQFAMALGLQLRVAEAVAVLDRVAAGLNGRDPQASLVLQAMAVACGSLDARTAPSVADQAASLLAAAKRQAVPRSALGVAAYVAAFANEPAETVATLARQAVAAGPRPLPEPHEPAWFPNTTIALMYAERFDEVRTLLDAAVSEARAAADGLILPVVLAHRAWLALRIGDLAAAEADARALLEAPVLRASLLHRLMASGVLVEALVERGELEEAERAIAPLVDHVQSPLLTAGVLRHARGHLRMAQRRLPEALGDFQAVGEISTRAQVISPTYLPWRSSAAIAHLALGERDAARRLADEELELARAFGGRRALGVALRAAGLARDRRGEPLLREAVEVLDAPATRLEQARAATDLGAFLRRDKRRVEARELLRRALDVAHRAGAGPLADRAETELRATGARPRRVALTGLEALTACERRIAELAVEGLTNREIAEHLFVTARTVEGHLTHVFQKLDIASRTDLPALLRTAGPALE